MGTSPSFREWLGGEIDRQGLTRRALARRLAAQHPEGVNTATIESSRRAIYKYLDPASPTSPTPQTRQAFAQALGVDPSAVPTDDDEEDEQDLAAALLALTREAAAMNRRIAQVARAVSAA